MADQTPAPRLPKIAESATAERLGEKMQAIELRAKEQEVAVKAASMGVPYIDLVGFAISPEALSLVPREQAEALQAICFLSTGDEVRVGAVDPTTPDVQELLHQVRERANSNGAVYMVSPHSFRTAIKLYDALPRIRKIVKGVEISEADLGRFAGAGGDFSTLQAELKKATVTDVVTIIIAAALNANASDVHVEAEEGGIAVRFRLDGILHDVATLDRDLWPKVASRIKLLAGLKINVTDRPQDGRFTIFLAKDKIDVRVSMLPTTWGESVVMRLLRASGAGKSADFLNLGIRGRAFEELKKQVERPNGMIVTTGPTGSGKTTTLYSILKHLNSPEMKIITLEDPVEYKLEGINQSQIDHSKDYTFAKGLRSILRQDPDVVMVGEIRDSETARIVTQAALTGHLVLSTLHTNDAPSAVTRLINLGVEPYLVAAIVRGVLAQRLVRKICVHCKEAYEPDAVTRKAVEQSIGKFESLYRGAGCAKCRATGFSGRVGIFELFIPSEHLLEAIGRGANLHEIRAALAKLKYTTLRQDGLRKAVEGLTTVEEVFYTTAMQ